MDLPEKDPLQQLMRDRVLELMESVGAELNIHVRGDGAFHFSNADRLRIQSRLWKLGNFVMLLKPLPGPMVPRRPSIGAGTGHPAAPAAAGETVDRLERPQ